MQPDYAVFVDRDGTINVDVDFLTSPGQLHLIPRSADAIRELNELGIPVVVITNQSGIARGLMTEEDVRRVHSALDAMLLESGARVIDYYYCPHHPTEGIPPYIGECDCRKPKPGMLEEAHKKYGFTLSRSFVIGDKCIDVQTARAVGASAIQVSTGYGTKEKEMCTADRDYFAADLYDAVQFIKHKLIEQK